MSDNKVFLNNEQLNNATGGYIEDDVARKTYNKEVKCPNCKKRKGKSFCKAHGKVILNNFNTCWSVNSVFASVFG